MALLSSLVFLQYRCVNVLGLVGSARLQLGFLTTGLSSDLGLGIEMQHLKTTFGWSGHNGLVYVTAYMHQMLTGYITDKPTHRQLTCIQVLQSYTCMVKDSLLHNAKIYCTATTKHDINFIGIYRPVSMSTDSMGAIILNLHGQKPAWWMEMKVLKKGRGKGGDGIGMEIAQTKGVDRYGTEGDMFCPIAINPCLSSFHFHLRCRILARRTTAPIFGPGEGHHHECPQLFEESSRLCLLTS